ncbi:hypothetical protein DID77_03880 [Candidatus Marinamargulisbacteria bacterium SCGC AG-439-L15]|nr:hypothetical protein DID77_03880 [Candidatus Marinamargulisbacteria bacterium SCGC AG-439-L15]
MMLRKVLAVSEGWSLENLDFSDILSKSRSLKTACEALSSEPDSNIFSEMEIIYKYIEKYKGSVKMWPEISVEGLETLTANLTYCDNALVKQLVPLENRKYFSWALQILDYYYKPNIRPPQVKSQAVIDEEGLIRALNNALKESSKDYDEQEKSYLLSILIKIESSDLSRDEAELFRVQLNELKGSMTIPADLQYRFNNADTKLGCLNVADGSSSAANFNLEADDLCDSDACIDDFDSSDSESSDTGSGSEDEAVDSN